MQKQGSREYDILMGDAMLVCLPRGSELAEMGKVTGYTYHYKHDCWPWSASVPRV